jgi:ZIP family zinc transporter/zinc and cadmium transporter
MSPISLSILLGLTAALANIAGGAAIAHRQWEQHYLKYFVALGAGFMLATALVEMVPESIRLGCEPHPTDWCGHGAGLLVLLGYMLVHFFEHSITPHFHFGEEVHRDEFVHAHTGYSVLLALLIHTFFDGIAIASGFLISNWLGWVIFGAIFLHKLPEGFTVASVMLASGRSRRTAFYSAVALAAATLVGVLVIELVPSWLPYGLPISAGVALYVAATDLVPEVNREPGVRMALVFFAGVAAFLLLRMVLPAL